MKGTPCPWSKNPELQCVSKLEVSTWLGPGPQQSCKRCRIGVLKSQGQPGFKKAEDAKEQTQTDKQKKTGHKCSAKIQPAGILFVGTDSQYFLIPSECSGLWPVGWSFLCGALGK